MKPSLLPLNPPKTPQLILFPLTSSLHLQRSLFCHGRWTRKQFFVFLVFISPFSVFLAFIFPSLKKISSTKFPTRNDPWSKSNRPSSMMIVIIIRVGRWWWSKNKKLITMRMWVWSVLNQLGGWIHWHQLLSATLSLLILASFFGTSSPQDSEARKSSWSSRNRWGRLIWMVIKCDCQCPN